MPEESVVAEASGAVALEVVLLGRNGIVHVEVDPAVEHAELHVRTADLTGPSAEAIEGALRADPADRPAGTLRADIQMQDADPDNGSRVEVIARVPPGSSVEVVTDRADVDVVPPAGRGDGEQRGAAEVGVDARGGEVRIAKADQVDVTGAAFTWVGEAGRVDIRTGDGRIEVGRCTDRLTVEADHADVVIDDAAGGSSQVGVASGDIAVNVSGTGQHRFSTGTGLVTGTTTSSAATITARDSRGPVTLQDLRPTPGGEAAAGGAATTAGTAAAAPVSTAVVDAALQAAAKVSYQSGWLARHEGTGGRLRDTPVTDEASAMLHDLYTQGWDDRDKLTDTEVAAVLAASHGKVPQSAQGAAARPAKRDQRSGGLARG